MLTTEPMMVPRFQIVCESANWMAIGPPDEITPPTSFLSEKANAALTAGPVPRLVMRPVLTMNPPVWAKSRVAAAPFDWITPLLSTSPA